MDGNQLLRHYLSSVERDVGTQSMSNHEIVAYLEPRLGPMFRGVFDVAGQPNDMSGGPFCFIVNTHPSPQPGHWVLVAHAPHRTPVAFDSYGRPFGPGFLERLQGHARTNADVDQFRREHCGQLCCAAAVLFRDRGLDVLRASA